MATIKDVAQAAQVSAAAVSRVLNKDDNISVTPEVRARIFQAAHVLGYVSPRQRKAAEHKTHLVIGVADWRIIRPDRHNVRLSSLSCLVQMMTDQYEVTFVRLTFGEPQKVDGIIALGVFSEKEIDFLRSLSFAIVFVNSNQHNYEFDQVQVDFDRGQEQMVSYLLDQKRYEQLHYRNQTSYKTVWHPKECCRSEYPCGKRKDLRSAGKKRSRKDNDHENAAWPDAAHFWRGKNLGETFAGERKEIASPHWQSD